MPSEKAKIVTKLDTKRSTSSDCAEIPSENLVMAQNGQNANVRQENRQA